MISQGLDERYVEEGCGQMWRRMMRGRISATTRGALAGRRYVTLLIATYMREKSFRAFALPFTYLLTSTPTRRDLCEP
jgi:hypothetical protein